MTLSRSTCLTGVTAGAIDPSCQPLRGGRGDGLSNTISLFAYQTGEWLLRNSNSYGSPDIYFAYGGDWGTPMVGDWNGPGALTVDMMPFNQNWDAVNQSLSMVATDYSLEDLLRFALDPSTPLDATATLVPVPPTATSEPTQVKPTPQTLPQGPDSPPPLPNDAVEVTETPLPTEPPTATEAPALPTEPPVATEAPVMPTDNPPEVPTTEG